MSKLGFALVGCGSIARKHAHALHSLSGRGGDRRLRRSRHRPRARVLGRSTARRPSRSIRGDDAGGGRSDRRLLRPHARAVRTAKTCSSWWNTAGPSSSRSRLALRLDDADRMIEACDAHGVKLFVVHQNRYNLPIVKAREALEQGRFGRLVLGTVRLRWTRDQAYYDSESWRGTWAHDGGVFMNQAAHHIDMLTWFMGQRGVGSQHGGDAPGEDRMRGHGRRRHSLQLGRARRAGGDDGDASEGSGGVDQHPRREGQRRDRRLLHERARDVELRGQAPG